MVRWTRGKANTMSMIKGITVTLYDTAVNSVDPFGDPTYTETAVDVSNVLVAPASNSEILDATNLYGKKAVYTLAIPKGDTHEWENRIVEFFGKRWRVFGIPTKGIEANIPLDWNKKVTVELYE